MRHVHTVVQAVALLIVAWAVWKLAGVGWSAFVFGISLFSWSVLAELNKPRRKRDAGPNLRDVA